MIDKLLEKFGLKFEDLNDLERDWLTTQLESLQKGVLSVEKIREYISGMKSAVEHELTKTDHNSKQDLFLKARLRNYLLLEAFLSSPQKAQQALEDALSNLARK